MSELTFSDFCDRLTMEDILKAAGYRFNRRDGMRYPCYVAVDTAGCRIRGDKFIVMPDRRRCFQPPFQQTYNVISFIRSFPEKFSEYQMGMNVDRLVNLVCNRLLNSPVEMNQGGFKTIYDSKPFDLSKFKITSFDLEDWNKSRQFYPYFRARGIDMATVRAFSRSFILTSKTNSSGKEMTNLSFPLRKPSTKEGQRIIGLELRSRPDHNGKTKFKGLAQGSEATAGLWMANPDTEQWKRDLHDKRFCRDKFSKGNYAAATAQNQADIQQPQANQETGEDQTEGNKAKTKSSYSLPGLPQTGDIYWFESGYDAMAYYQLNRKKVDFKDAIFVSTSGNPSVRQFQAVMKAFPKSHHHLCFDNDMAGMMFSLNFLLNLKGEGYCTRMDKDKEQLVIYDSYKCEPVGRISCREFYLDMVCQMLDVDSESFTREVPTLGFKDWNDELLALRGMMPSPHLQMLQPVRPQLMPQESKVEKSGNAVREQNREASPKQTEQPKADARESESEKILTDTNPKTEQDKASFRMKF